MSSVSIPIEDLLDWLGVKDVSKEGREWHFKCPFPGHKPGSSNSNSSFREARDHPWWIFNCFVCGSHGTAIDFYARHQSVSPLMAKGILKQRYGSKFIDPGDGLLEKAMKLVGDKNQRAPRGRREERQILPLSESIIESWTIDWFDIHAHPEEYGDGATYMFERGFSPRTLTEWEVGIDPVTGMIAIPYRDDEHRFLGGKGRAWWDNARPRYKMLGNREGKESRYDYDALNVSQVLFGTWKLNLHSEHDEVVLCEGELNCMALWQKGWAGRCLGMSGQFMSDRQAQILRAATNKAMLIFDEEEKAFAAAEKLIPQVIVTIVPERDEDPADASGEEIEQWLASAVDPLLL